MNNLVDDPGENMNLYDIHPEVVVNAQSNTSGHSTQWAKSSVIQGIQ